MDAVRQDKDEVLVVFDFGQTLAEYSASTLKLLSQRPFISGERVDLQNPSSAVVFNGPAGPTYAAVRWVSGTGNAFLFECPVESRDSPNAVSLPLSLGHDFSSLIYRFHKIEGHDEFLLVEATVRTPNGRMPAMTLVTLDGHTKALQLPPLTGRLMPDAVAVEGDTRYLALLFQQDTGQLTLHELTRDESNNLSVGYTLVTIVSTSKPGPSVWVDQLDSVIEHTPEVVFIRVGPDIYGFRGGTLSRIAKDDRFRYSSFVSTEKGMLLVPYYAAKPPGLPPGSTP